MNKIPVARTIGFAYRFTFGQLGVIIGLIWLPMLLIMGISYFAMSGYADTFEKAVAENNAPAAGQAALLLAAYFLAVLFLYSTNYAAVTRQALGLRQGGARMHLELTLGALRMFGAMLALTAALAVFYSVLLLAALAILSASRALGPGAGSQAIAIVGLGVLVAGVAAFVFVAARLAFLIVPVVVAEHRITLTRGWELTRGNFWRIFWILEATLVPLLLIVTAVEFAIFGAKFFAHAQSAAPTLAERVAQLRETKGRLPLLYALTFLTSPFISGLGMGAAAGAYRALTDETAEPSIA